MSHNTTDGKPLNFERFKVASGVIYPINADVPNPIFARRGRRHSLSDEQEDQIQANVQAEAEKRGFTGRAGRQWRQNQRRSLRAKLQ